MKIAAIVTLCVIAVGVPFVLACRWTMVLERRFVMQFKVAELKSDGTRIVRISGWSGHGFWSVKDVSAERVGSSITVIVRLFLARPGTIGGFQYEIPVPGDVNQIRFGKDETVIWHR